MAAKQKFERVDVLVTKREQLFCTIEYKVFPDGHRECDITYDTVEQLEEALKWLDDARKSIGFLQWKVRHPYLRELDMFDPDRPAPPAGQ